MTTVIRWNPFRELEALQGAFENVWRAAPTYTAPVPLDAYETDAAYTLVANLPGLKADDISVKLHEDVLTISAEVSPSTAQETERVLVQERTSGKFSRSVRLPKPVNMEQVEATYENGVVTLTLPKAAEAQPKRITIKTPEVVRSQN